jgi:reverse gyrase
MRTDSTRVEPEALQTLRDYIKNHYGAAYLPETPHFYKSKKNSQDAHEAIRPTSLEWTPEKIHPFLEKDEFRLYQLIWNRFIASQMMPAIYDQTAINIISKDANAKEYKFRSTGSVIKFRGFTAVYSDTTEEDSEEIEAIVEKAIKSATESLKSEIAELANANKAAAEKAVGLESELAVTKSLAVAGGPRRTIKPIDHSTNDLLVKAATYKAKADATTDPDLMKGYKLLSQKYFAEAETLNKSN